MSDIILALTESGKALDAKIGRGIGIPLEITRVVSGAGRSNAPTSQTNVIDPRLEFTITNTRADNGQAIISVALTNAGVPALGIPPLAEGYPLSQVGIFARDPDLGEILFRISQHENPLPVPAASERGWTYQATFNIAKRNAAEVIVNINPLGLVTAGQIEEISEKVDNVSGGLGDAVTQIERLSGKLEELQSLMSEGFVNRADFNRAINQLQEELAKTLTTLQNLISEDFVNNSDFEEVVNQLKEKLDEIINTPKVSNVYILGAEPPEDTHVLWIREIDKSVHFYDGTEWRPITSLWA